MSSAAGAEGDAASSNDASSSGSESGTALPVVCDPLVNPGPAAAAAEPSIYPPPRLLVVGDLGARAQTLCVDLSALPASSALAARLPTLVGVAGLALGDPGDCGCDWTLTVRDESPELAGEPLSVWEAGASSPDRYALRTVTGADHRAATAVWAVTERGALYAIRAAVAIYGVNAGRTADATVVDYPSFVHRGLLEGFYGRSYTAGQRATLLALSDYLRLDTYIYGPKCDCHASQGDWRDGYGTGPVPAWSTTEACGDCEQSCEPVSGDTIRAAADDASRRLMRFVWAFSPFHARGFQNGRYDQELAAMKGKVDVLFAIGVREFALFIDDIDGNAGSGGDAAQGAVHAKLVNALDTYVRTKNPTTHVMMVGNTYSGAPNGYTDALRALNPGVEVLWTGPQIVPTQITAADLAPVASSIGRRPSLWDNWAYKGALEGRAADLPTQALGYFVNPVESECALGQDQTREPNVDRIQLSLGTIADYSWDAGRYAASDASREASHTRWQALRPGLVGSPPAP